MANRAGQPSKYKPEYCEKIIKFFQADRCRTVQDHILYKNGDEKVVEKEVANDLPFFSAFAREIGVCDDTLSEWTRQHKEFSAAYKTAKELQEEFLVQNGLKGLYNAAAFIFTSKNILGWRDTVDMEHSGKNGGPIQVIFTLPRPKREKKTMKK